jgi:uncharacterized protein (TIGR00288 family)
MDENKRVAVLIDAENISASYCERILSEASNYGDVIIKRVFGDWSNPQMQTWKTKASEFSLRTEQQFSAVKGKNSSDISLIIDTMTILFEKRIDVFCLASSDSDFTRLVQELREREKQVVGFGMSATAVAAFVNSFSEFVYLDKNEDKESSAPKDRKEKTIAPKNAKNEIPAERIQALQAIIDSLVEKYNKAYYGNIRNEMKNKFADFIPKNYGSKTMKEFISKNLYAIGKYKIETEKDGTTMYLIPSSKK